MDISYFIETLQNNYLHCTGWQSQYNRKTIVTTENLAILQGSYYMFASVSVTVYTLVASEM